MGFAIKIGAATSLRMPESWKEPTDDRQEKILVLGGVYVQDNGSFDAGDSIVCTAVFSPADYTLIYGYWKNRTMVDVIDKFGNDRGNMRVIVKSKEQLDYWNYWKVELELWYL